MVPTPITRHSTRASRVKVGPKTAMPRAMLSLTSSWINVAPSYPSQGYCWISCGMLKYDRWIFLPTWELELKANLARAHALERSMRSRKKGKASLESRTGQVVTSLVTWNVMTRKDNMLKVCPYLRPVSSLSRKWMTTVLKTKLENMVKRPAMPAREWIRCIFILSS